MSANPQQPKINPEEFFGKTSQEHFSRMARLTAEQYGLDPDIFERQMAHESINFKPSVVSGRLKSPKGATGIGQFMPETGKRYGLKSQQDLADPVKNLDAAARHMKDLLADNENDYERALAAYNAGQGRVNDDSWRKINETRNYVKTINGFVSDELTPKVDPDSFFSQKSIPIEGLQNLDMSAAFPVPPQTPEEVVKLATGVDDATAQQFVESPQAAKVKELIQPPQLPQFSPEEQARLSQITPSTAQGVPVVLRGVDSTRIDPDELRRKVIEQVVPADKREQAYKDGRFNFGAANEQELYQMLADTMQPELDESGKPTGKVSIQVNIPQQDYDYLKSFGQPQKLQGAELLIDAMQHPEKYPKIKGTMLAEFEDLPTKLFEVGKGIDEALYELAEPALQSDLSPFKLPAAVSVAINDRLREARIGVDALTAKIAGDENRANQLIEKGRQSLESSKAAVGEAARTGQIPEGHGPVLQEAYREAIKASGGDPDSFAHQVVGNIIGGATDPANALPLPFVGKIGKGIKTGARAIGEKVGLVEALPAAPLDLGIPSLSPEQLAVASRVSAADEAARVQQNRESYFTPVERAKNETEKLADVQSKITARQPLTAEEKLFIKDRSDRLTLERLQQKIDKGTATDKDLKKYDAIIARQSEGQAEAPQPDIIEPLTPPIRQEPQRSEAISQQAPEQTARPEAIEQPVSPLAAIKAKYEPQTDIPEITPRKPASRTVSGQKDSLLTAISKIGIDPRYSDIASYLRPSEGGRPGSINKTKAAGGVRRGNDYLLEQLRENGWNFENANEVFDAVRKEQNGHKVYSYERDFDADIEKAYKQITEDDRISAEGKAEATTAITLIRDPELKPVIERFGLGEFTDEDVRFFQEYARYVKGADESLINDFISEANLQRRGAEVDVESAGQQRSAETAGVRESGKQASQLTTTEVDRVRQLHKSLLEQGTNVDDYLRQQGLFGSELNPQQQALLKELSEPSRKAPASHGYFAQRLFWATEKGAGDSFLNDSLVKKALGLEPKASMNDVHNRLRAELGFETNRKVSPDELKKWAASHDLPEAVIKKITAAEESARKATDAVQSIKDNLSGKGVRGSGGPDTMKLITDLAELAKLYVKQTANGYKDFRAKLQADFAGSYDALKPHLLRAWKQAKESKEEVKAPERSSVFEILSSTRKAGLLSSVKTHARNILGTATFNALETGPTRAIATLADIALSPIAKRRTVTGYTPVHLMKRAEAKAYFDDVMKTREAENLDRLGLKEIKVGNSYPSKALEFWINGNFKLLSAEDRMFKVGAFRRSLEDRALALAKTEKLQGQYRGDAKTRAKEIIKETIRGQREDLTALAITDAEIATFQNKNIFGEMVAGAKRGLEKVGEKSPSAKFGAEVGKFAIDTVIPFPSTPANVVMRALDYAGVGVPKELVKIALDKAMTPEHQRRLAISFGRAATGIPIIITGWKLAEKGLMTGALEDTTGERGAEQAAGRIPGAILIGSKWRQVSSISPLGTLLTLGATMQREHERELKEGESRTGAMAKGAIASTVATHPLAESVEELSKGRVGSFVEGLPASFVPSMAADVAGLLDTESRQAQGAMEKIKARVPGLKQTLPVRRDALGRTIEQPFALDPFRSTKAKESTDPIVKEIINARVLVSPIKKKAGESNADFGKRAEEVGKLSEARLKGVIESKTYSSLDDSYWNKKVKRAALSDAIASSRADYTEAKKNGEMVDPAIQSFHGSIDLERHKAKIELEQDKRFLSLTPKQQDFVKDKITGIFSNLRVKDKSEIKAAGEGLSAIKKSLPTTINQILQAAKMIPAGK